MERDGYLKALERSLIAGKLEAKAVEDIENACAWKRMAAIYRLGVEHALEGLAGGTGDNPPRRTREHREGAYRPRVEL